MNFETRLREQATAALDITEKILQGDMTMAPIQQKTALAMIGGQIKQAGVNNGRITQIISLTKLGVRDAGTRESIARAALEGLLPPGTLPDASGPLLPAGSEG